MLKGKKTAVIFTGVLFCGLWLFFTQRVQQNQMASYEKSVDLMLSLADENLRNYFETTLETKESIVLSPFSFLLTLDADTLEPKTFMTSKDAKESLSALSIKSSYKASGSKNDLFIYTDNKMSNFPYLVRVAMVEDAVHLEGMPARNIQNALEYAMSDQNWVLTDDKNHTIVSSTDSRERLSSKELSVSYISRPIVVGSYRATLYIKKFEGYSVSIANIFGIFGIGLITLSLIGFMREGGDDAEVEAYNEFTDHLEADNFPFDEDDEDDVQMVRLESEIEPFAKEVEAIINTQSASKAEESSVKNESGELDYSEFLMENPILGEKASVESRLSFVEDKPKSRVPATERKIDFIEDDDSDEDEVQIPPLPGEKKFEVKAAKPSPEHGVKQDLEIDNEDYWLKLAEELTESLEDFTVSRDDEKVTQSIETPTELKG